MMCEAHMCDVLAAHEIDTAFIDHSLSYHENCTNLYNQFGVRFRQRDYNKEYRRYQDMAENIEVLKPSSLVLQTAFWTTKRNDYRQRISPMPLAARPLPTLCWTR